MSDNFSLIIKNGSCYTDGKLTKTDIGLSGNKIKKIGKIELNSSKVYDAQIKLFYQVSLILKFTLESQDQLMQKI